MTLDEAIEHCENVAAKCFAERSARNHSGKCGFEHLELAGWLKELKAYKEQEPCEDAREAIKTLKENLCGLCAYGSQNMESCDIRSCDNRDAIKALEAESCEDAISREAALEAILTSVPDFCGGDEGGNLVGRNETASYIRNLPSVTPKQKTGEILTDYGIVIGINGFERRVKKTTYCSLCKCDLGYNGDLLTHYCPNCGVKLKYKGR